MTERENEPGVRPTPQPEPPAEPVGILTRVADGRRFLVGVGGLRVGRKRGIDLPLADRTVSRHHADIRYENGRYVLYDNSANGSWVNGTQVIAAQPLRDGDSVKFGDVEFSFAFKSVTEEQLAELQTATQPSQMREASTVRMKGVKRRARPSRRRRVRMLRLVYLAGLLTLVGLAIYLFLPDVADQLISLLPAFIRNLLGSP